MYLKEGHRLHSGKYQLVNILGEGGFSLTYRGAWKTELQGSLGKIPTLVPVCIKEYFFKDYCQRNQETGFVETNTETGKELFEKNKEKIIKEARILSEINHPNVVNVLEVFKQNNTVYIVMEFISGYSLKQQVEQKGVFQEDKLKKIIYKIGQALDYIHEKNILHLDIKPSNILIDKNNNPKLIDFGISKRYDLADDQQTSTTLQAASKGYASIEQYDSEGIQSFSPRPDIYSLGATMYYLSTGQVPTESILRSTKGLQPPREINPAISEKTEEVILKAMALHADDRYETIMDMLYYLGYNPIIDQIDMDTIAEKTELVKKIKETPYDADQEDATMIHPPTRKEKKSHLGFYLSLLVILIAVFSLFILFKDSHSDPENQTNQTANSNDLIFSNYFDQGLENFNKRNLSQAKEQFINALEIKEDQEARTYIHLIDSISNILVSTEEKNVTEKEIEETKLPAEEEKPEEEVEIDPAQENYLRVFNEAIQLYNQQDYSKALPLFIEAGGYKNTADVKKHIDLCNQALKKIEIEEKLSQYEIFFQNFGNFDVARKKSDQLFGIIDKEGNAKIDFIYLTAEIIEENCLFQRNDDSYDLYAPSGKLIDRIIE